MDAGGGLRRWPVEYSDDNTGAVYGSGCPSRDSGLLGYGNKHKTLIEIIPRPCVNPRVAETLEWLKNSDTGSECIGQTDML